MTLMRLMLSSFQLHQQSAAESFDRQSRSHPSSTSLANPELVSTTDESSVRHTNFVEATTQTVDAALQPSRWLAAGEEPTPDGMSLVRENLQGLGLSERTQETLLQSCRESTWSQYSVYLKKWQDFAVSRNIRTTNPGLE